MAVQEVTSIAVCARGATDLESLVETIRTCGRWGIVPIEWPNEPAIRDAYTSSHIYVLHSSPEVDDELGGLLQARPAHVPLIVLGCDPARHTAPNLWLPVVPPATLLGLLIDQLLERSVPPSALAISWRRKSDMIIGNSTQIQQLLHSLDQLAPAQTPIIITGESGVGKELVARALHFCGPRGKHPFIAINCAAIPENLFEAELFGYQRGAFTGAVNAHAGAFEAAHDGTLFLDEIGEMPLNMQAKLLRVLETSEVQRIGSTEHKKVNFRLVSATNRTLEDEVAAGRFREDLYYRIQVYPIHIPPLRERPDDIPALVAHHLSTIGLRENRPAMRLRPAALEKLVAYDWPGNVRELINLLERAVLLAEDRIIDAKHIIMPHSTRKASASLVPYRDAKAKFELDYYSQLLRTAAGNVSLAAKLGQKTRKEVYDALKRLNLDATLYRTPDD